MTLRVIDVSANQGLINIAPIDCDAVIVKGTGGDNYVNDCCDFVLQQCFKLNKPAGLYHYAHEFGNINDPIVESNYFIDNCKNYFGKVLVALDYEVAINGRNYTQQDVEWCYNFIQNVIKRTGVVPLLYISKSLISECDWSKVANANVGLWYAQYADNNQTGWLSDPWDDGKPTTPFSVVMHQYTGHGRINGYNGDLDLSLFYGDTNAWNAYTKSHDTTNSNGGGNVNQNDYLTAFAKDVLAGKYGNGNERKEKIYQSVQNKVNELSK